MEQATQTSEAQSAPAPQSEQPSQQSDFSIPEGYADKGWAKDIKSQDDLWKLTDNAQSLIGKRPAGIPTADAPQEEWDKFKDAMRPDSPEKYELPAEFEGFEDAEALAGYKSKMEQMAHNAGLTPKQAQELWGEFMNGEVEAIKGAKESKAQKEEALEKEFDELGGKLFGDNYNDAISTASEYLKGVLPPELEGAVESMADNNKGLLALVSVANHSKAEIAKIKAEYGAEDKLSSGGQAAGVSVNEITTKLSEAKTKFAQSPVFSQERKDLQAEIDGYRAQLQKVAK